MKVSSTQKVAAAQLMPALLVAEAGGPAVVHQGAAEAGDEADRLDGLLAALGMQELQRQRPVGEDMQPLVFAVDPQAGFVGMQGRRVQQAGAGGLLPSLQ